MFIYVGTTFALAIIYLCYNVMKKKYSHWSNKGIEGPTPVPFFGNFGSLVSFEVHFRDVVRRIYTDFPNATVVGIYQGFKPSMLVRDPEMIKQILINDFEFLNSRGLSNSKKTLYNNLFLLSGEKWKMIRQNLTPLFTNSKLKNMIPRFDECVKRFLNFVDGLNHDEVHEFQDLWQRFSVDATCASISEINVDMYGENKDSFSLLPKLINATNNFWWVVEFIDWMIPKTRKILEKIVIEKYLDKSTYELTNFLLSLVSTLNMDKEKILTQNNSFVKNMFELQKKNENKISEYRITDEVIAAQFLVITGGGMETGTAIIFVLLELARHQDIQDRVYKEICEVFEKHAGKITNDALNEMTYLQMTYYESLRLHPVVGIIIRSASQDYELPEPKVKIEKGTQLIVSIDGLHMDPQYYKNPEVFNPERFSPNNKKNIPKFAYLPFGDGPRQCIGSQYAKIMALFGLAAFLKRFKVDVTDKTPKKLKFNPRFIRAICDEGIWIKISRRV